MMTALSLLVEIMFRASSRPAKSSSFYSRCQLTRGIVWRLASGQLAEDTKPAAEMVQFEGSEAN